MTKSLLFFVLLFFLLEDCLADGGGSCGLRSIIDETSERLSLTFLLPIATDESSILISDHEIIEIGGIKYSVVGDEETSCVIPLVSKKPSAVSEATIILNEQDIEYLSLAKKSPPPLPTPLVVGVSDKLKADLDKIPLTQNYFFSNPEGKVVGHVSVEKKQASQFYLQSPAPLTPQEFARYTAMKGREIKLRPVMKTVEGETVHVQGGLRELYEDTRPDDYFYKRMKPEEIKSFSSSQFAYLSQREVVFAQRANEAFHSTADEIGIAFEVEQHDYSYTHVGYWRIKKVPGVSLYEYRKSLGPEQLKEFNEKLRLLQEKIKHENRIAGRMSNRYFNGTHTYKGIPPKKAKKILQEIFLEAGRDEDKYVDILAERGYLADIDTGRIRFDNEGLGGEKDMNNCYVYEINHKGKTIPKFHCYDI